MADTAAHLVDRVLPEVPVRQWVLSLPFALRYRLAYDAGLTSAVLGVFVRTVFASLRRRARRQWNVARGQCGAVTFVQRFGDALNLNLHFHSLVLDGVYETSPYGRPRFHPLPPPDDDEVARVVGQVATRIARLLERRGLGPDADPSDADPLTEEEPLLAELYGAPVTSRIATGRRAGQPVIRVGDCIDPDVVPELDGERCANVSGVSLHANVAVPARDRKRLERLCRYVARPPVATERLSRMADGRLLYRLKHRWRDGTTHVVFEPGELVEKLAALVPPPRFHLVRYHGVLGPCASQRSRVVPGGELLPGGGATDARKRTGQAVPGHEDGERVGSRSGQADVGRLGPRSGSEATPSRRGEPLPGVDNAGRPGARGEGAPEAQATVAEPPTRPQRLAWADLLRRVFAVDVLECPRCGARTRLLAAIHPPDATNAILECLGLPARARPLEAARRDEEAPDPWETGFEGEGS